eukprot:1156370-Pelagomonas_calceolata.AAC.8
MEVGLDLPPPAAALRRSCPYSCPYFCPCLLSRLDIGLDLPPPAAALRRSLPPNPAFDMGPLIPGRPIAIYPFAPILTLE